MNAVICVVLAILGVLSPLSETGFINKLVVGIVGGNQTASAGQSGQNYRLNEKQQQLYQQQAQQYGGGYSNPTQTYKNTTWHIENEDYLTPNANESSQHKQRPPGQYGGGGTYDKKSSTSRPYKNTTSDIVNEEYLTPNANESSQHKQRPPGQYGGGGTYDKKPGALSKPRGSTTSLYDEKLSRRSQFFNDGHAAHHDSRNFSPPTGTPSGSQGTTAPDGNGDGDVVFLQSGSTACCYSGVREPQIQHRRLRCNETDCRLEKASEKSSLWTCGDLIRCTVANANFSGDVEGRKLMECAMDGRNIITVQNKPIKCGPNEKAHNGVCRQVFGE